MKTSTIVLITIGVLVLLIGGCSITNYNGMNTSQKEVQQKWAEVQSSYQRRFDLIPNLVQTVKGAADFEKSTFIQTAMARSGNLKSAAAVDAKDLTPEKMAQIQKANAEAGAATRMAINVAVEQYPQLRATEAFRDLQTQLEGTENRIKQARDQYNAAVKDFNIKVSNFPGNIFAKMFGFKEMQSFQSDAGAEKRVDVKF
jgi:LemA protein